MKITSAAPVIAIAALASCSPMPGGGRETPQPSRLELSLAECRGYSNVAKMFDDSDVSAFIPDDMMVYHFRLNDPAAVDSVILRPVRRRGYAAGYRLHTFCNGKICPNNGTAIQLNGTELSSLDIMVEYTAGDVDRREYYRDTLPYVIELESVIQHSRVAFSRMEFYSHGRRINDTTSLSICGPVSGEGFDTALMARYAGKVDGSLLGRKVICATPSGSSSFKIFDSGEITVINDGKLYHGAVQESGGKLQIELQLTPGGESSGAASLYINGHDIAAPALGLDARYDGIDSDLINLKCFGDLFKFDIKYATTDNFTHSQLYPEPICYLRYVAARDLMDAARFFKTQGVMIKMFDGYRPRRVQYVMWDVCPNPNFLSPPSVGSIHNRGGAVDLTLVYPDGSELDMGTPYDFCGPEAYTSNTNLPDSVLANRGLLIDNITRFHFNKIRTEWWHFSHSTARAYPLLEFVPDEYIQF